MLCPTSVIFCAICWRRSKWYLEKSHSWSIHRILPVDFFGLSLRQFSGSPPSSWLIHHHADNSLLFSGSSFRSTSAAFCFSAASSDVLSHSYLLDMQARMKGRCELTLMHLQTGWWIFVLTGEGRHLIFNLVVGVAIFFGAISMGVSCGRVRFCPSRLLRDIRMKSSWTPISTSPSS